MGIFTMTVDVNALSTQALKLGQSCLAAIIILFVGRIAIKLCVKSLKKVLDKRDLDPTVIPFLLGLTNALLFTALILSILSTLGIKTTSFVAILGAAGLAVGMALQGSLSNFAGGVLILIFRPFRVGDFIEAQGHSGSVSEVGIFCTTIKTGDNKTIILPNGPLASGSMVNYSKEATRRIDMVIGCAYSDDLKAVQTELEQILKSHPNVLQDRPLLVRVGELGDNAVNFNVRSWVNSADYWPTYYDLIETIKLRFDEKGFNFPFPQREIHTVTN